jgi:hypothetical protein
MEHGNAYCCITLYDTTETIQALLNALYDDTVMHPALNQCRFYPVQSIA